jgi:hypothetical protein
MSGGTLLGWISLSEVIVTLAKWGKFLESQSQVFKELHLFRYLKAGCRLSQKVVRIRFPNRKAHFQTQHRLSLHFVHTDQ